MSTYKRCRAILLPATNRVVLDSNQNGVFDGILKGISKRNELINTLAINKFPSVGYVVSMWQPQHLYILSNDKISVGDWVINGNISKSNHAIVHINSERVADEMNKIASLMNEFNEKIKNIVITKKIIASTDNSLHMPQLSERFIQIYCNEHNKGNCIGSVMVEYNTADDNMDGYVSMFGGHEVGETLKVTTNGNNIIIKKVRDTRTVAEVIQLCQKAMILGVKSQRGKGYSFNEKFLEFLDENDL
jgi:hypothetical protein